MRRFPHLPSGALARVRLIALGLAVLGALAAAGTALAAHGPAAQRAVAAGAALALAAHWLVGHRRGRTGLAGDLGEAAALFLALRFTPGAPLLPLLAILYRSLYGGPRAVAVRYALCLGALFAAHLGRGADAFHDDLSRAAGLTLAPVLVQGLAGAIAGLEALAAEREHAATHDPLTGLANRRRLFARLEEALAAARTTGGELALLLVDLDHFKELNDTLGHVAGDRLLREIGPRLACGLPEADLAARVGGDEFAVLLRDAGGAPRAAERLRAALEAPFAFQGLTLLVRASVGIAVFPDHGADVETLMQRADIAMYSAKAAGGGQEVYTASRDGHSRERLALLGELPAAIERGEIVVHYQPKLDLRTGALVGAEALARWQHPALGQLGPAAFLPLAEQTGLMRPLTLRVLGEALAQCARWRDAGHDIPVAVNLGAANLLDLGLPGDVAGLLAAHGVDPARLQLEITETIVAADPVRVIEIMERLRALGVSLSLDDFGTGSSSLAFLRRLPVQELKIDKSFVLGIEDDPEAATIVETVVGLAHNLGLRAVGEGVETEAARAVLAACGCDHGQGFLLGRPVPADALRVLSPECSTT